MTPKDVYTYLCDRFRVLEAKANPPTLMLYNVPWVSNVGATPFYLVQPRFFSIDCKEMRFEDFYYRNVLNGEDNNLLDKAKTLIPEFSVVIEVIKAKYANEIGYSIAQNLEAWYDEDKHVIGVALPKKSEPKDYLKSNECLCILGSEFSHAIEVVIRPLGTTQLNVSDISKSPTRQYIKILQQQGLDLETIQICTNQFYDVLGNRMTHAFVDHTAKREGFIVRFPTKKTVGEAIQQVSYATGSREAALKKIKKYLDRPTDIRLEEYLFECEAILKPLLNLPVIAAERIDDVDKFMSQNPDIIRMPPEKLVEKHILPGLV